MSLAVNCFVFERIMNELNWPNKINQSEIYMILLRRVPSTAVSNQRTVYAYADRNENENEKANEKKEKNESIETKNNEKKLTNRSIILYKTMASLSILYTLTNRH